MEKNPLISIIIPIYNVHDYLEKCLESVINQTYKNLEIIITDDGSTDGSSAICDEYAQRDTRIRVIHQENAGVVMARKKAIENATGIYTCFVDGDDRIDCKMIEYFAAHIGNCDLITSGMYLLQPSCEIMEIADFFKEGIYETCEAMEYIIANMIAYKDSFYEGMMPYLWNKMYRTDFVKAIMRNMNPNLPYAEDRVFLSQYVLKCNSVRITHKSYYYYCYRKDSAIRSANKNFMRDLNEVYLTLEREFEKHPLKKSLMHQLQLYVSARIHRITEFMGFDKDTQSVRYTFPFPDLESGSKIILYGAGAVGTDYYRVIFGYRRFELVAWVDKNWSRYKDSNIPVISPKHIKDYEYDYIILAVRRKELANQICEELEKSGMKKEKILWRMPSNYVPG